MEILLNILRERRVRGSTGFVVGQRPAACFFDAPPYALCETIEFEKTLAALKGTVGIRYEPYGLMFSKRYVYIQGGRPVIYDRTEDAKNYLPENEWWRIVRLDLSDVSNINDFTHEREWRVPDEFEFDISKATVLVPNAAEFRRFYEIAKVSGEDVSSKVSCVLPLGAFYG
jgi:hypothetical protein